MNFRNFMIALQALFVLVGNLQTFPVHGAGEKEKMHVPNSMILEFPVPNSVSYKNSAGVAQAPEQARETNPVLRGKRFDWLSEMDIEPNSKIAKSDKNTIRLTDDTF